MDGPTSSNDYELQRLLEQEKQKAMFNELVAKVTESCWDKCIVATPAAKFSAGEAACLANCAQRFLEVSSIILRRFGEMQR